MQNSSAQSRTTSKKKEPTVRADPFAVADLATLADEMIEKVRRMQTVGANDKDFNQIVEIAEKWKVAARKVTLFILDGGKSENSPVENHPAPAEQEAAK